jgi:hypothetical protein
LVVLAGACWCLLVLAGESWKPLAHPVFFLCFLSSFFLLLSSSFFFFLLLSSLQDVGVNPNTIASNDINAILETYGVEAARASIVSEVLSVFGVYGINVDPRHLALIADYMTFEGKYRPMNRLGIGGSASPFLKMSFETSMNFLTAATTRGSLDNTESPSARIVLGRVVANGTGSCGVRMNWDMMQLDENENDSDSA